MYFKGLLKISWAMQLTRLTCFITGIVYMYDGSNKHPIFLFLDSKACVDWHAFSIYWGRTPYNSRALVPQNTGNVISDPELQNFLGKYAADPLSGLLHLHHHDLPPPTQNIILRFWSSIPLFSWKR